MTTISVTADHIANGSPGDCGWCPVALAVADALPDLAYLAIHCQHIDLRARPDADMVVIEMADEVAAFIRAFDEAGQVGPFMFELDYPAVTS